MTLDLNLMYANMIGSPDNDNTELRKIIAEVKEIIEKKINPCEGTFPSIRFCKVPRSALNPFKKWIAIEIQERIKLSLIATERDLQNLEPGNVDNMLIFQIEFGDMFVEYFSLSEFGFVNVKSIRYDENVIDNMISMCFDQAAKQYKKYNKYEFRDFCNLSRNFVTNKVSAKWKIKEYEERIIKELPKSYKRIFMQDLGGFNTDLDEEN